MSIISNVDHSRGTDEHGGAQRPPVNHEEFQLEADAGDFDIYEMALEVLEADEAYRMESSGSVSPESDVDRLLENADVERFSGDVTLNRIFSVRRDDEVYENGLEETEDFETRQTTSPFPDVENQWPTEELRISEETLEGNDVEASRDVLESAGFEPDADCRSVQSGSTSISLGDVDESGLRCEVFCDRASFSNAMAKDALIRTSLTLGSSFLDSSGTSVFETESELSLNLTSSDSVYSTDDCCFADSSFTETKTKQMKREHFAFSSLCPVVSFREPSPEELFDQALETLSDLTESRSSSQLSPFNCIYYDAQCSPYCFHRDPSPEDAFDQALETLSDVIDDDSSSIFIIGPRSTIRNEHDAQDHFYVNGVQHQDQLDLEDTHRPLGSSFEDADSCSSRPSSCGAVVESDSSTSDRFDSDALTAGEDSDRGEREEIQSGRQGHEELWSEVYASSPEPSFPGYSTDDCVEESDSSMTDYGFPARHRSPQLNFFQRLLHRKKTIQMSGEEEDDDREEDDDDLLEQFQICSIEDLMTDSDLDRDSSNKKATETLPAAEAEKNSRLLSLLQSTGHIRLPNGINVSKEGGSAVEVVQSMTPPIAQSIRTEVHFARKSKIPKLPEARTTVSPVRISW